MNTNDLKPNIYGLQQDVLNLLGNVSKLMGDVKETLSGDNSGEKYGDYQQDIDNAVVNVKELELRMAVVAPMKAGKSTIINAIIGDDLLPSRNAAMTTIPTEIILKKELTQPILILSGHIRKVFKGCYFALKEKIQTLKIEKTLEEKTGQYPHLRELIEEIHNLTENELPNFLDSEKIEGKENIGKALTSLNDIVRLVSILAPKFDPIEKLKEVPRIETGFCEIVENSNQAEQFGNLVIVDTPGANEAGENLKLSYVVQEQLEKCSGVFIVLDFTQLNNKAAEDVKRKIQPIINLRGKQNLYVLVNKIDQRKEGDMTSDGVKQFVYSDLTLKESENQDQIFEISAFKAFSATQFFAELKQNPSITLSEMKATPVLAKIAFGDMWEMILPTLTPEIVNNASKLVWNNSGFENFLTKAISVLMENAAPNCFKSSLETAKKRLEKVRGIVIVRNSAIPQDEKTLRLEIENLEADLSSLERCKTQFVKVKKIQEELERKLDDTIETLKKDIKVDINSFFEEEDLKKGNFIQKLDIKARQILLIPIPIPPFFAERLAEISQNIKESLEYKSKEKYEFNTKEEADKFAQEAVSWAKQRAENLLSGMKHYTDEEIEITRQELIKTLENDTKDIIEKARDRLNKTFDIKLSLPQPPLAKDVNDQDIFISAKSDTRKKTIQKSARKKPWYFLWLIEKTYTWEEEVDETYYFVSMKSLTEKFNESIIKTVDEIKAQIKIYLEEDFKEEIDNYFHHLDNYLREYKQSIEQAQRDQKLSQEQQKQLTDNLNSIQKKIDQQVEKSKTLMKRAETLTKTTDNGLN